MAHHPVVPTTDGHGGRARSRPGAGRRRAGIFRGPGTCGALVAAAALLALPARQGMCEWKNFTTADGLADNYVSSILADRAGNIWMGTSGRGVSRYDGSTWRTYTTADGLAGDWVRAIVEDRNGALWFATAMGVSRFDGVTWRTFTEADGLRDDFVYSLLEDRSGALWAGTSAGVCRFDGTTWTTVRPAGGLADGMILCIQQDSSGNLWFGTGLGASRFDGTTWRTFGPDEGLYCTPVTAIHEDRHGNIWFGTYCGASRFDGSVWTNFTAGGDLPGSRVHSIIEDRSGALWVGADGGAGRFDGSTWRTFDSDHGLPGRAVSAMSVDPSGCIWFATEYGGVSRFDGASLENFTVEGGRVLSFAEDRSGAMWFGSTFVGRYDGRNWSTYQPGANGTGWVWCALEDRSGRLWFGSQNCGVFSWDGTEWRNFTVTDGLADNDVRAILEDDAGGLWFGTAGGLTRYDGSAWTTLQLPCAAVQSAARDSTGTLWFGGRGMVCRFDGVTWSYLSEADGVPNSLVNAILVDRSGSIWLGTYNGVVRYDGTTPRTFGTAEGLGGSAVYGIIEDHTGVLWFATDGGLTRHDGISWRNLTTGDGLVGNWTRCVSEDRKGRLWVGTEWGISILEPDRIPPQTVIANPPPGVSPAREVTTVFGAAFGESDECEYSHRLDDGTWTAWTRRASADLTGLPDGLHHLEARSRDYLGNVDATPAGVLFEVDATPPAPGITVPAFGQPVSARLEVRGTAADPRFAGYRLQVRPQGAASWKPPAAVLLAESDSPVSGGVLGTWDTRGFPDGNYELRLTVTDSLGLVGVDDVSAIVDNLAPFADVTAPARVVAATGGDVYTTNAEVHLYFPPHAFHEDALVTLTPLAAGSGGAGAPRPDTAGELPDRRGRAAASVDTLPNGAVRITPGCEIAWGVAALYKPAVLELSYAGVPASPGTPTVYVSADGGAAWRALGGTVDADARIVSLPIRESGQYALFAGPGAGAGAASLADVSLTPRVFSPAGVYADREVGIGFSLGQPGHVTVKVYSRSGRLIRQVVANEWMTAGANLVRWDGTDRNGGVVTDGIYLVTIEALGRTETRTVAVVK